MRKFALAVLAIPVLTAIYLRAVLRTSSVVRTGVALGLGSVLGLGAVAVAQPAATTATLPIAIVPVPQAAFRTLITTDVALDAPATIAFSTAMDRGSVAEALQVQPATAVRLVWNDADTLVSIVPGTHWAPDTYHTITIQPGALATTGRPITSPARASFLTRGATTAVLGPTSAIGERVAVDTAFSVLFDRSIDVATVGDAVRLDPPVEGAVSVETTLDGAQRLVFTPAEPLAADQAYNVTLSGILDADGVEVPPTTLEVKTVEAPGVVRFRPLDGTGDVDRDQVISVRFTQTMDRSSTKKAWSVTVDGKAIEGTIRFAEDDSVLVFTPAERLPYDAKVVATVAGDARSVDGAVIGKPMSGTFTTEKKPAPAPRAATTTKSDSKPESKPTTNGSTGGSSTGGGSAGGGSWAAVERYYLGLMNCTRTGGWVSSSGDCDSPGGRNVAALKLDAGISSKVARPYAKLLATRGECSHFIGGNPGDRLSKAGYKSYRWAENIGCRSGNARAAVLATHRFFQSEKSTNGGHWVNMMNAKYDRVGIGVWVSGGRVRLVVDFYHP